MSHLNGEPQNDGTVNALYNTLLHATGEERDRFNLDGRFEALDRAGPLEELLV